MAEKLAKLRDPAYRGHMVRQIMDDPPPLALDQVFVLSPDDPRYDHRPEDSLAAHAQRLATNGYDAFIELSLADEGRTLFIYPFLNHQMSAVESMLADDHVVLGLGDSGAHCGQIMDASLPTYFLRYWVRERQRFGLAAAIRKLTAEPAALYGLTGRGTIAPGGFDGATWY